jgi:MFS family permease
MWMQLRPNVSRTNIITLCFISIMLTLMVLTRGASYPLLLTADYNVSAHDSAGVTAKLALVTEIFLVPCEFFVGGFMDKYGRKWPMVSALLINGLMLILVTTSSTVWPTLTIYTIFLGCSFVPVLLQPLWFDYVAP